MAQSPEDAARPVAARDGEMVEISLKFPRGTGSPTDGDIVNRLFDHHLEQDDLDQILAVLSQTERSVLIDNETDELYSRVALGGVWTMLEK
jgi:hypothetical protein